MDLGFDQWFEDYSTEFLPVVKHFPIESFTKFSNDRVK